MNNKEIQAEETLNKPSRENASLALAMIPFYLMGAEAPLFRASMIALAGLTSNAEIDNFVQYGGQTGFNWLLWSFFFCIFPIYRWAWPIFMFEIKKKERYREEAKNRLSNIWSSSRSFFKLFLLGRLTAHIAASYSVINWWDFFRVIAPAMAITTLVQYLYSIAYLDAIIGFIPSFMEKLYGRDNLWTRKSGDHISIGRKIAALTFSTAVVPAILTVMIIQRFDTMTRNQTDMIVALYFQAFVVLFIGVRFFSHCLERPLVVLGERMKKLSAGDFDVKTTILFNDEISTLKDGFNEMVDQLREREELKETFGKYVSIEIARQLIEEKRLDLGGESLKAAVIFCDIRSFTSMSEKRSAREIVELLNRYFSYITPPISRYHGVINKFIGDAVLAVFMPTFGSEKPCDDALSAAIEMQKGLSDFNRDYPEYEGIRFGIGIHYGPLVAGNVGTDSRREYTVIGDTVNVASRIEGQCGKTKKEVIISKSVLENISPEVRGRINDDKLQFIEMSPVSLKGKSQNVALFGVE